MVLEVALQGLLTLGSFATCVFALWLVPRRAGALLSSAFVAVGGKPAPDRRTAAGAIFIGYLSILVSGVVLASGAVQPWVDDAPARWAVAMAVGVLVPAAIAAAGAPFALVPLVLTAEAGSVPAAIARSFELASTRGALASVRDAAISGAGVGLIVRVLAWKIPLQVRGEHELIVALAVRGALVVGMLAGFAVMSARTYVAAREASAWAEDGAPRADTHPAAARRIAALFALLAPALASVVAAMIAAAVTPTPMREAQGVDWEWPEVVAHGRVVDLAGPHGLRVHRVERGVSIETADGGGAGFVPYEPWTERPPDTFTDTDLIVVRTHFDGGPAFAAFAGRRVVYFDEEGVRLEDGLSERLSARIGHNALGALCVALILALAWSLRLLRALGDARALDARATSLGPPAPRGAPTRLAGRLRLGQGAVLRPHGMHARLIGDARVVSRDGDVVLAVPQEVRLFAAHDDRMPRDGDDVEVIGHLGKLTPIGMREGALAWPTGARLLIGGRADAAERLISRAARGGALVAALVAAMIVVVALSIVTEL